MRRKDFTAFQVGIRRYETALNGIPDRIPVFAQLHEFAMKEIGAVFLATATPAEVAGRVKYYIEAGGKKGRLILYLCNLGATTPPANVTAAVEAVHQYGDLSPN